MLLRKGTPEQMAHDASAWRTARDCGEFIIFVKPEIFASIKAAELLAGLLDRLHRAGVTLLAASLWDGPAMSKHCLMERCYLPLNVLTRLGADALRIEQIATLRKTIAIDEASIPVVGAYAFLEANPHIGSAELAEIVARVGTVKLGAGAYASMLQDGNGRMIILNGFHPFQLQHLSGPYASVLAFACRSETPLPSIRTEVVGDIFPASAVPGSFRRWLSSAATDFRPSAMFNGVHVSPGPFEAAFHVKLFFPSSDEEIEVDCNGTVFARRLRAHTANPGASDGRVDRLLRLASGRASDTAELIKLFEETEGVATDEAVARIDALP